MKKIVDIALTEYGTKEFAGNDDNPEVIKYANETGIKGISQDEIPWCSTFVNWCAMKAELENTRKPNARSWLEVGQIVTEPQLGDIVIFWRESPTSWKGHVGIFIRKENGVIYVLSGNQKDEVNISPYSYDEVLGYRRLRNAPEFEKIEPKKARLK